MQPECRVRHHAGRIALYALGALILLPASARALDPDRHVTQYIEASWTSETGLPQNSVHAIAQTTDGYLWLGTEEGLARFDGTHFTIYNRENSDGLTSDYIQALAAGPDGSLWIGTDSGLAHYSLDPGNPASGRFHTLTAADGLAGNSVTTLCEDRTGDLWVGTTRG
ncbi:MAG: two-component regulator propeller domain-containing protein, partial [Acidobacteriota bacterium]